MFPLSLHGQVAWVTGGSRGIGKAAALALAQAGARVAISYHGKHEAAEAVAAAIRTLDQPCLLVPFDVRDAKAAEIATAKIQSELGDVSILVNSAGIARDGLFLLLETEQWDELIQTNLMGYVNTTKAVIPGMLMQRWGRIINMSSTVATQSGRGQASYAASKAAIEAMTRSVAAELGGRGITANCIAPGVVETDMSAAIIELARDEILARQLVKRFASAAEIGAWVVFLASEYGAYMTGQVLKIDGGFKMP